MNKEFLYMQKLAGLITESEYNAMLNENQNDLIVLKNLTDERHGELFNWMKSNLTTEPYNFGLLWLNGPLEGGDFGLQKNKLNQEDIPALMQYLEDNGYL